MPADKDLRVAYSVNKEDMWISHIPVPVAITASAHANDDFSKAQALSALTAWNIYSPVWAPVSLERQWLKLRDKAPFDYAKGFRVDGRKTFPCSNARRKNLKKCSTIIGGHCASISKRHRQAME